MSDMGFICPACKRPTHPTDNEIIEYLVKEKDKYRDILGERTRELTCTREALDKAKKALQELKDIIACPPDTSYEIGVSMYADGELQEIIALEQKYKKYL